MTAIPQVTQTYQSTLMQKLLGRNYKWAFVIQYHIKNSMTYFWSDFFWFLGQGAGSILVILVWYTTNKNNSNLLTQIIIGNLIFSVLNVSATWSVSNLISGGKLTTYLLAPANVMFRLFCRAIAGSLKTGFSNLIVYSVIIFFAKDYINFPSHILVGIAFVPIAFVIRFLLEFIVGCMSFWFTDAYGIINFYENFIGFFAGVIIPFSIINVSLFYYLPTAYISHFGTYSTTKVF